MTGILPMKTILAIIRNEKVRETEAALEQAGACGFTTFPVTGRGRQGTRSRLFALVDRNRAEEDRPGPAQGTGVPDPGPASAHASLFLPQTLLVIAANDSNVKILVETLIATNQTGEHGDGKIFVCPMISAIRVRNGDLGDQALEPGGKCAP